MKKKGDTWLLSSGFPADTKKVEGLLGKLEGLKHGLPVARSDKALSRFKVATNDYSRYLQLQFQAGVHGNVELYMGTGAGARQSHVSNGKQEAVYTATIASYDLPATEDSWQDKDILQLDIAAISAIEVDGFRLYREAP